MFKISPKASVGLSTVLAILFLIAVVVCAFAMPWLVDVFFEMSQGTGHGPSDANAGRGYALVVAYLILSVAVVADAFLLRLLLLVHKERVFTESSVFSLRVIAWCCILAGVLFGALGGLFRLSLAVGFVAVFVGLCLRVVKNVLEEATFIKSENDLTV